MLMVLFWQDAKPAGPQRQRFKWSKSFFESLQLSKKNRQILHWKTFFIGSLRPMLFIPTSNVPDPKDIKTHRLPIVGADRITHGCHCLNGWCVVVFGYATCSCNERMTWWPQPFCTLNVVLLICSIKFSAASTPFFGVVLKGRNPHPSSLLKVPDIIVPAIFICLDVGTRKPEL